MAVSGGEGSDQPVTVLARHAVRPQDEEAFERWMSGITDACNRFEGYLGSEVIRPLGDASNEFVSIFRFDTFANLDRWLHSPERDAWLGRTGEFSDEPVQLHYHSLEFWFSPERHEGRAPPKHRMALVTFLVIWPLVHFVPRLFDDALGPGLAAEVASVGAIVLLMTYAVMPLVTSVFARWLFPQP